MACVNATDEQIDAACELLPDWSECESCTGSDSIGYSKYDGCIKFCIDGQIYFGISLTETPNKDHPLLGSKKAVPTWLIGTICDFFVNRMEFIGVTDDIKTCCSELKAKIDQLIADQKSCCEQLNTKIDNLQSDVTEIKTDVKSIKTDISSINTDISSIKNTVEGIDNKVDNLNTSVSNVSNTVNALAGDICKKSDCDLMNSKLDVIDDKIDALSAGSGGSSGCTEADCAAIKAALSDILGKIDSSSGGSSGAVLVDGQSGNSITFPSTGLYKVFSKGFEPAYYRVSDMSGSVHNAILFSIEINDTNASSLVIKRGMYYSGSNVINVQTDSNLSGGLIAASVDSVYKIG